MEKRYKCRECANFLPIEGTVYGHCKVRPFAMTQGGRLTDKEFLTMRGRYACWADFVKADKIPELIRKCRQCGEKFVSNNRANQVFCCDECRTKWYKERRAENRAKRKEEEKKIDSAIKGKRPKVKQPKVPLSEVMRMAAEEDLSYGQIVQKYGL